MGGGHPSSQKAKPVAPERPTPNRTTWAWKVVLAPDLVRHVVASDAVGAARLGDTAGQVLTIERIGEGLVG